MTREDIEQLNGLEPYCFETAREEQWYKVGLKEGLKTADTYPKSSPWISVDEDLPCNHEELVSKGSSSTKRVIVIEDGGYYFDCMVLSENGKWKWFYSFNPSHWFPIPEPPKE